MSLSLGDMKKGGKILLQSLKFLFRNQLIWKWSFIKYAKSFSEKDKYCWNISEPIFQFLKSGVKSLNYTVRV